MVADREEVGDVVAAESTPSVEVDDEANDNSGSSYCSDGEGDTRHDGRNPRNQPQSMPRAIEGDPCDLVGPSMFGYRT
jgi:hypothetical protein